LTTLENVKELNRLFKINLKPFSTSVTKQTTETSRTVSPKGNYKANSVNIVVQ